MKLPVAIVFADIRNSTQSMNEHEESMIAGLKLIFAFMEELASQNDGHIVSTMGDGLLVVFEDALDAFNWCEEAQTGLLDLEWPSCLCKPVFGDDGTLLYNGVSVRIGIHYGIVEKVMLMGRPNYLGSNMNMSSRICSQGSWWPNPLFQGRP